MKVLIYILLGIMILILLALGLYLIIGYSAYKFVLKRNGGMKKRLIKNYHQHLQKVGSDEGFFDDNFQKIQIESQDKLKLFGFYKSNNSNRLAILVHGYAGDHMEVANAGQIFDKKGYDILAIDMRSHGLSEGEVFTMGKNESEDLLLWINKALEINNNYKIVLYGQSMGASTVCLTIGEKIPNNVVLAIEDCGYDNVEKQFSYVYTKQKIHFKFLFKIFSFFTKNTMELNLKSIDAISKLKQAKIPVLFIHGEKDDFVPTEMVYNLSSQIPESRRWVYIAPEAGHVMSYAVDPKKYERKINEFLSAYNM